ncbi:hypothetical protein ACNKHK_15645 [Shigella flexneri]
MNGIPADSRAGERAAVLNPDHITPEKLEKVRALNALADDTGKSCPDGAGMGVTG